MSWRLIKYEGWKTVCAECQKDVDADDPETVCGKCKAEGATPELEKRKVVIEGEEAA